MGVKGAGKRPVRGSGTCKIVARERQLTSVCLVAERESEVFHVDDWINYCKLFGGGRHPIFEEVSFSTQVDLPLKPDSGPRSQRRFFSTL